MNTNPDTNVLQGTVCKKTTGVYWVQCGGKVYTCAISTRLRKHLVYPERDPSSLGYYKVVDVEDIKLVDPVAIGDVVNFIDGGHEEGLITEILPRHSKLTRRAAGRKPLEQVLIANADQILVTIASSRPVPDLVMLDRYLISAEAESIPAVVVITKWDEVDERRDYIEQAVRDYERIGYRVIVTSSQSGLGIDEFREAITGKFSILIGMSGVGKSSLLNAVQPGLGLRVSHVSTAHGEGRHTTTHLEMFPLEVGGGIVDTPGMREFGLWNIPEQELIELFPETADFLGACKFVDCTHRHEPKCAIREAAEEGIIPESRYRSYLKIRWSE